MAQGQDTNALNQLPQLGTVDPPDFPSRPDLFDEVEWGPLPSAEDVRLAYKLWSLVDGVLAQEMSPDGPPTPGSDSSSEMTEEVKSCLAHNVYEHLKINPGVPPADGEWDKDAQMQYLEDGTRKGWSYRDIFGVDPQRVPSEDVDPEGIRIQGELVRGGNYWNKKKTKDELERRGVDVPANIKKVDQLRELLIEEEIQYRQTDRIIPPQGLLPREDQSIWGNRRKDKYTILTSGERDLSPLDMYTWAIVLSPYNPAYWVSRSYLFYLMGFFDLALGDAYRAQLLCETAANQKERNQQPGFAIRICHAVEQHILEIPTKPGKLTPEAKQMREPNGINYFIPTVRKALHNIMSLSLLGLQCWKDYAAMEEYLPSRMRMDASDTDMIKDRKSSLDEIVRSSVSSRWRDGSYYLYEKRAGYALGRLYPYSEPVNRSIDAFLKRINEDILRASQARSTKIEVKSIDGDLGVFALVDINENETIYVDEPSVRGHLPLNRPPKNSKRVVHCENCKREISSSDRKTTRALCKDNKYSVRNHRYRFVCPCVLTEDKCDGVHWCVPEVDNLHGLADRMVSDSETDSGAVRNKRTKRRKLSHKTSEHGDKWAERRPQCLEIARELYHYRACGIDWTWLYDAMRPNWNSRLISHREHAAVKRPHKQYSHTNESQGTILSLLLREVFDITLLRREKENRPNLLPHEIEEMMPLMGAEDMPDDMFPFTLAANIKVPFDILLCLGVDIFRDLTFDTWVIQTVLRKLLLNVVPWAEKGQKKRDLVDPVGGKPEPHNPAPDPFTTEYDPEPYDPTIRDLYIFPGLALFNNVCKDHNNAVWEWDDKIPNRVKVTTTSKIHAGDEIFVPYRNTKFTMDEAYRVLGGPCDCTLCESDDNGSESGSDPSDSQGGRSNPPNGGRGSGTDSNESDDETSELEREVSEPVGPKKAAKAPKFVYARTRGTHGALIKRTMK
ncbi:hypothetical protein FQN54_000588 [Arachnomyces sp. PD_36]|nr:hypothetical protein FQN54_000588 [Arachnomyces sp. PD_36]